VLVVEISEKPNEGFEMTDEEMIPGFIDEAKECARLERSILQNESWWILSVKKN
jgi:hypothetical protein